MANNGLDKSPRNAYASRVANNGLDKSPRKGPSDPWSEPTKTFWLIHVTQADIDAGERHSTTHCPLALAIRRVTQKRVAIYNFCARLGDEIIDLPEELQIWRSRFDREEPVQPFVFYLKEERA